MTDQSQIPSFSPREHIRRRPGMYVGGQNSRGMHELIDILLGNPICQALLGNVETITVILEDGEKITVSDDSQGLSGKFDPEYGQSLIEHILKGEDLPYHSRPNVMQGGEVIFSFCSGDMAIPNALAYSLEITVKHDSVVWFQKYQQGIAQTPLTKIRLMTRDETTGVSITISPDFEIFEPNHFNFDAIENLLRGYAYTTRGLKIILEDRRSAPYVNQSRVFQYADGFKTYMENIGFLSWSNSMTYYQVALITTNFGEDVIDSYRSRKGCLEIVVKYTLVEAVFPSHIFINGVQTHAEGIETQAFMAALQEFFSAKWGELVDKKPRRKPRLTRQSLGKGVLVGFNIQHPDPYLENQGSAALMNREFYPIVYETTMRLLDGMLETHRDVLVAIARRL